MDLSKMLTVNFAHTDQIGDHIELDFHNYKTEEKTGTPYRLEYSQKSVFRTGSRAFEAMQEYIEDLEAQGKEVIVKSTPEGMMVCVIEKVITRISLDTAAKLSGVIQTTTQNPDVFFGKDSQESANAGQA